MGDQPAADRLARTEALFRAVNERIAETAERSDAEEADFVCECTDPGCTHRIELPLDEYDGVRSDPTAFVVADGHEDERIESTVESDGEVAVVRKRGPEVEQMVRKLDPRTDDGDERYLRGR